MYEINKKINNYYLSVINYNNKIKQNSGSKNMFSKTVTRKFQSWGSNKKLKTWAVR